MGYDADDLWIMVEDEFLATAKLFTQHLHHAEYQRLKKRAEEHDAGNVARPVDGRTALPISAKRELDRKRQDDRIAKAAEQNDKDPWQHDPLLGALMDSPTKTGRLLTQLEPVRSKTRAAAGFLPTSQESPDRSKVRQPLFKNESPERTAIVAQQCEKTRNMVQDIHDETMDEDDSDDLDKPIRKSQANVQRESPSRSPVKRPITAKSKAAERSSTSSIFARYSRKSPSPVRTRKMVSPVDSHSIKAEPTTRHDTSASQAGKMSRAEMRAALRAKSTFKFDSWNEDEQLRAKHTPSATDILKKRTVKLEKLDKQESKATKDTKDTNRRPTTTLEIPTFLDL